MDCMDNLKTDPIGSTFQEGEHILQVRESKDNGRTCTGCWYASQIRSNGKKIRNYNSSCYAHGHACTSGVRKDGKQVVFVKIN